MQPINFLTYTIPKFIKRNDFDRHSYLFIAALMTSVMIVSIMDLYEINLPSYAQIAVVFSPFVYYIYLIFNLVENDYDFDINELNLSNDARQFVSDTTNVYEDELRFFASKMTFECLSKYDSHGKNALIQEICNAIESNNTLSNVIILGHSYGRNMDHVDKDFVAKFIKCVEVRFAYEDLIKLRKIGTDI